MNKKFDQDVYDTFDAIGKETVTKFLVSKGYEVTEHPFGIYGIDLMATSGSMIFYFDAEVRSTWKGSKFPFSTIHLPARKKKLIQKNSYFVAISGDLKYMIFISGATVTDDKLTKVKTKYFDDGEDFYDIPLSQTRFETLQ